MSTLGSVAANARKPRIQLLEIMLPRLSLDSLNALISELVLCTKDKNAITRALSYTVLTKIAAKKFTDQLMETEDGEVVDLSAAHGAISSAQVRSKSKKTVESAFAILEAPDGRIIVREKKNVKEDMDMLSSDDEEGLPENIRLSDQKVARYYFLLPLKIAFRSP